MEEKKKRHPNNIKASEVHEGMSLEELEQTMIIRHVEFAKRYVLTLDAEKAAQDMGYPGKAAFWSLLRNPKIQTYIRKLQKLMADRFILTADRVIQEQCKIAFANMQDLYDEKGDLKHIKDLHPNIGRAISEVTEEMVGWDKEADKPLMKRKYKMHDKVGALHKLSMHLGLYEKDNAQKTGAKVTFILPDNRRDPLLMLKRGYEDAEILEATKQIDKNGQTNA